MPNHINGGVELQDGDESTCEIIIELTDAGETGAELIEKYGTIKHYFPLINSYAVELPKKHISQLKMLDNVVSVSENTQIAAQMNNSRRAVRVDSAHRRGYDGSGITLAFLDTGIAPVRDFTHPKNRILAFRDFVGGMDAPYDDNGHGTHVPYSFPRQLAPVGRNLAHLGLPAHKFALKQLEFLFFYQKSLRL